MYVKSESHCIIQIGETAASGRSALQREPDVEDQGDAAEHPLRGRVLRASPNQGEGAFRNPPFGTACLIFSHVVNII